MQQEDMALDVASHMSLEDFYLKRVENFDQSRCKANIPWTTQIPYAFFCCVNISGEESMLIKTFSFLFLVWSIRF